MSAREVKGRHVCPIHGAQADVSDQGECRAMNGQCGWVCVFIEEDPRDAEILALREKLAAAEDNLRRMAALADRTAGRAVAAEEALRPFLALHALLSMAPWPTPDVRWQILDEYSVRAARLLAPPQEPRAVEEREEPCAGAEVPEPKCGVCEDTGRVMFAGASDFIDCPDCPARRKGGSRG